MQQIKCHKPNHFAAKCHSATFKAPTKDVKVVYSEMDEAFPTEEVSAIQLDDSQMVSVRLESGKYLCFQVDTSTQCDVASLSLYKKATTDFNLECVTKIQSYGGATLPVVGRTSLKVFCKHRTF